VSVSASGDHRPVTRIRPAQPSDVDAIVELVRELARYEREPDAAQATTDDFHAALFGLDPRVHAQVAEVELDGRWAVVGMAVWFVSFSTWTGRHGLWLEDLFVLPEHRRLGLGRALLATLAGVCAENSWTRFEWWVLDWNEPAHAFYRSLGAVPQDEWTTWRLDGDQLAALANA
jgi:GNAT superfamily N-acetyltransferase